MRARIRDAICGAGVMLVVTAAGGPVAAQTKAPIRIGEINSYSGLGTVYTFPYREGLLMPAASSAGRSSSSSETTSSSRTRR